MKKKLKTFELYRMAGDRDGQSIVSSDEKLKRETSLEKEKDHTTFDVTFLSAVLKTGVFGQLSQKMWKVKICQVC